MASKGSRDCTKGEVCGYLLLIVGLWVAIFFRGRAFSTGLPDGQRIGFIVGAIAVIICLDVMFLFYCYKASKVDEPTTDPPRRFNTKFIYTVTGFFILEALWIVPDYVMAVVKAPMPVMVFCFVIGLISLCGWTLLFVDTIQQSSNGPEDNEEEVVPAGAENA